MTPVAHAANGLDVGQPQVRVEPRHSRLADYQELFKVRVTAMVVITAWAGFYLGSMRSGITSIHWGLLQSLLGIALVSCGASVLNQVIERRIDAKMVRTAKRPLATGRFSLTQGIVLGAALLRLRRTGVDLVYQPRHRGAHPADRLSLRCRVHTAQTVHHPGYLHSAPFPERCRPCWVGPPARGVIEWPAVALFGILFVWQFPHFMAIAWLYREDYAKGGIRMLPVVEPDGWSDCGPGPCATPS